ncbi:TonB-dependent receptor [Novosphingobium sp.]|uniref:TonB-dependent receptor n=1 Tax=Novosphingobium sp. TaxID=1874826 RepID=UPI0022BAEC52|nr:TonB-dependent receptor [Novosphingobium sp.]MCZ8018369.1 TonB-dependent receptor [Novosphingobium sp.]MCZ8033363.1 TonB-dependent receptor [Novosphingobium sp.]MCZ8051818.1 TonB-dependent receptor [Novosphingobium sp.]MCZ8060360.1 TonB-dependent receptor [Novosphingobium sp.]MCZ8232002.1 TonB-dependent receptor [Novosphingobium sp.]
MKPLNTRTIQVRAALLAAAATVLATAPAHAQQAAADEAPEGEIIVTAQKRAQSSLDVGITLSVAGEEVLAAKRVEAVTDLVSFTPNVSVKDNVPGLVPVITIRGVGLNDFSATNNPSAGVYVDEVSLSSLALMNFDFFDLARLEVLKGPQGTLYGRTATAGALNIVTARPSLAGVEGRIGGSWGNYQAKDIEGMINLPVSETLALRLAAKGIFQDKGHYFNQRLGRDIGRREVYLGRVQALWEPSERVEVLLKVEGQSSRSELGSGEFFGAFPTPALPAGAACPGAPQCSDFFGYFDNDGDPFRGNWSVSPDYNLDQLGLTARIQADLGFATLTSVTGYIKFDRQWSADTDAGPLPQLDFVTDDRVKQFSQEVRLSGESDLVNWLVGGFYSSDHVETSYSGDLTALFNTTSFTSSDQRSKSRAVFANGEWRLADALTLVTGLRYTSESRTNVGGTTDLVSRPPASFLTMAPFGSPPIPIAVSNARISDTNWSWKLGLNWKPSPQMLVYASATQGIKSGGFFAGVATSSGQLLPYRPEKLIAYELGIKGRAPALGLGYSLSGFYYDYNDVQTFIRDVVGSLPIQRLGNVKTAKVYGLDADFVLSPAALEGLTLNAGLGLLHTEIGSFASSSGVVPAGNQLPDAPEFSLNLGASYEFALSGSVSAKLAVDGRYQSSAFKDALNDPVVAVEAYWVWNARASILRKGDWDLSIWGKNLGNKRYVTQGVNQTVLGVGFRVYGAPRTYGVSISKSF